MKYDGTFRGLLNAIFKILVYFSRFQLQPFNESDRLSTSQSPLRFDVIISKISKTQPIGGGFGAQRKDGYGVSYFVDEHKGEMVVTCLFLFSRLHGQETAKGPLCFPRVRPKLPHAVEALHCPF